MSEVTYADMRFYADASRFDEIRRSYSRVLDEIREHDQEAYRVMERDLNPEEYRSAIAPLETRANQLFSERDHLAKLLDRLEGKR